VSGREPEPGTEPESAGTGGGADADGDGDADGRAVASATDADGTRSGSVTREALAAAVREREDELVAFLERFVAIDAENPPGRRYADSVDFLADAMRERGYDVERVPVPEAVVAEHYPERTAHGRENVLGRVGAGDGPAVHFTGHFDVVPAGEEWTREPYEPTVEDGRLYGRGASDMKSGIAASLFAVDALAATTALPGTITQSMTCDEETGGFTGLGYLVEEGYVSRANTDYCVYTECFDSSRICIGHRGVLKFRVRTGGRSAHGCMAHDGENALMAMHDFLGRVDDYRGELHGRTTDLPVTPEESRRADVSATMISAGTSENVVPDRCEATFYRVLVPGEDVETARAEVRALMDDCRAATGASVEYEEIMYAAPTAVPEDCEVARTYLEHVGAHHEEPGVVVSPGSDDQRFVVNDAGIEECIVYGPGLLEQAHVPDEYVPVEEVVTAATVMATATADLLGVLEE
jgi:succinyl-diaminopimelate desuccinylase